MSGRWITCSSRRASAEARLLLVPWAGAGPSCYRGWSAHLSSALEPWTLCLPGRETRFNERPRTELPALVDEIVAAITPWIDRPFAIFGHSLGALLGFEISRRLRARRLPLPLHLFSSGRGAPQLPGPQAPPREDPEILLAELRAYGGVPAEVLAEPELLELLLPVVRADLELARSNQYHEQPPLPLPVTAFGGLSDLHVPPESLEAWGAQTTGRFRAQTFAGGHFYLLDHVAELLTEVEAELHLDLMSRR